MTACSAMLRTPLVSKNRLAKMNFKPLASTVAADGELFYELLSSDPDEKNEKRFLFITRLFEDRAVPLLQNVSIPDLPTYRIEVDQARLLCAERKLTSVKNEYYDTTGRLTYLIPVDPSVPPANWLDIKPEIVSPLSMLYRILCNSGEASK